LYFVVSEGILVLFTFFEFCAVQAVTKNRTVIKKKIFISFVSSYNT
jgi:hypothetical protein